MFWGLGLPINCPIPSALSSVTVGLGFKKAPNLDSKQRLRFAFATAMGCVGCAGVCGYEAMGITFISLFCWATSIAVLCVFHTYILVLLSHHFKSVTCVYSVIFSIQRLCTGCRVVF